MSTVLVGSAVHPVVYLSGRTPPSGAITFDWYANGTCDGAAVATSQPLLIANGVVNATQFAQIPRKVGTYAFRARYSGDATYAAIIGDCRALTVPKAAPRVLGSSVAIEATGGDTVVLGATTEVSVALSITGDTPLNALTVSDVFENDILAVAAPLPSGCTLAPRTPDPSHDSIVCTVGRVPLSAASTEYKQSLRFSFRAIRGTGGAATSTSAHASFTFEGFGQVAPNVIGPSTTSVQVVDPPRLALPPETSATQGDVIDIPVRLQAESLRVPTTFTFTLGYDPNLLNAEAILPGDFSAASGPQWTLVQPGRISVSVVSVSGSVLTNGLGSLVVARFTVSGSNGESTLTVENVQAIPLQANAAAISVDSGQGAFVVRPLVVEQQEEPPPEELPTLWDPKLWTTDHVTKSLGYAAVLVVTLTLLAEIFNGTIEENRNHFPGWWRRRRLRSAATGSGLSQREGASAGAGIAMVLIKGSLYLLAASVLFALLRPERVFHNPGIAFAAAGFALIVTTSATQLPRWFYMRYLHRTGVVDPPPHGQPMIEVHADFWTLVFAAVCVLLAYVTEVRPGYAYGIVGVLAVNREVRLRPDKDRGQLRPWRMELAGMTCLFLAALLSWLAYSAMHGGHDDLIPRVLEEAWALGSETVALGLIPLSFLPGKVLWNWNRPIWAGLWGFGMFLYIQSITPSEPTAGPLAIALTLVGYGLVTAGFWSYFRYVHNEESCESCRAMEPELVAAA